MLPELRLVDVLGSQQTFWNPLVTVQPPSSAGLVIRDDALHHRDRAGLLTCVLTAQVITELVFALVARTRRSARIQSTMPLPCFMRGIPPASPVVLDCCAFLLLLNFIDIASCIHSFLSAAVFVWFPCISLLNHFLVIYCIRFVFFFYFTSLTVWFLFCRRFFPTCA